MSAPLKPGVHRAIAKDGTIAAVVVASNGRIVEMVQVGHAEPRQRAQRRWVAPSLQVLRERAHARRMRALADTYLELQHRLPRGGP